MTENPKDKIKIGIHTQSNGTFNFVTTRECYEHFEAQWINNSYGKITIEGHLNDIDGNKIQMVFVSETINAIEAITINESF